MSEERTSRRRAKQNKKKKKKFKIIKRLFFLIILIGLIGSIGAGVMTYSIIKNIDPIDPNNIYSLLNENSFILDKEGNMIEEVQTNGLRTNVSYKDIPPNLVNAFIAIEDKTFWEHSGFNIIRIFGAIWEGIRTGGNIRGTSTITQQLARNLYLPEKMTERSMERKIEEAYYAVLLEKQLTKEQIIEAYLNTIYLGFGTSGVQAAAQAYFSKDIEDLNIAECAVIAGITKNPSKYAPLKRLNNEDIDPSDPNIISVGETYTLLYDDRFRDRQLLVLKFMLKYGFINQDEYDEAVNMDMRTLVDPSFVKSLEISSYFIDKVKSDVLDDLKEKYSISEKEAHDMLYNAGLKIYSTINLDIQKIVENEFKDNSNFPSVNARKDKYGNILDSKYRILLYKYGNLFDSNKSFVLQSSDYKKDTSGNLVLLKNKKLTFDSIEENDQLVDVKISIKDFYKNDDTFTMTRGGRIVLPNTYKSLDSDGNVVIGKAFLEENPDYFTIDSAGRCLVSESNYTLNEEVMQPQSAMVIIDPSTGEIKALVGGRNIKGKMLFSRATSPTQPGSSIKPLGVYTPALDNGWTAASIIDDAPMFNDNGKVWPRNWYTGFKGLVTLREAVKQSINVAAVKVCESVGIDTSKKYLKNFGITSLQESGPTNDNNAAALALGGMTRGVSPLEMTGAYATLANKGVYIEPISYVKVEDRNGNIILDNIPEKHTVIEKDTAFIMTNILVSAVRSGTGSRARLYSGNTTIPVAGKTGTTTSNYDAWFMGYTPYYAAGVWIGNDLDIKLSQGSSASATLWSKIMKQVHEDLPAKNFEMPSNIIRLKVDNKSGKLPTEISYMAKDSNIITEYFVSGTQPTEYDDIHVLVDIDIFTNRLATPSCPPQFVEQRVFTKRPYPLIEDSALYPDDYIYEMPRYYCPLHNPSYQLYPTDIDVNSDTDNAYPEDEGAEENNNPDIPSAPDNNNKTENQSGQNGNTTEQDENTTENENNAANNEPTPPPIESRLNNR